MVHHHGRCKMEQPKKHELLTQRLVELITRLNAGECLSIQTLKEHFRVSERTLIRDFQRLERYLPLEKTEQGYQLSHHGIGHFSFKEVTGFAELSGVKDIYPSFDLGFLNEFIQQGEESAYHVKGLTQERIQHFKLPMEHLKQAIECHMLVQFEYKETTRTVEPYRLIHHAGVWYLAGVEQGRLKTYHVSRMRHLQPLHQTFIPDVTIQQQVQHEQHIWFVPQHEKIEVHVQVNADVVHYFKQRALLPEQMILNELADGCLLLSCKVSHKMQIFPLVRFWIPHLKIVSPVEWQGELENGLLRYLNNSVLI